MVDLLKELKKNEKIKGAFFIRYWDGGPHIRLRMRDLVNSEVESVHTQLEAGVARWKSDKSISREDYYRNHNFDGQVMDYKSLAWFEEGTVAQIPYVPEIERYGGKAAMFASELAFEASSLFALNLIRHTVDDYTSRLSLALRMMLLVPLAMSWLRDIASIALFFDNYAKFWQSYSAENRILAARLEREPADPKISSLIITLSQNPEVAVANDTLCQLWLKELKNLLSHLAETGRDNGLVEPLSGEIVQQQDQVNTAIAAILTSHLHMLNNRLAVGPGQELCLAMKLRNAAYEVLHSEKKVVL